MKPARRGVVVSGVGLTTPLGDSPAEIWRAMAAGRCAATAPVDFDVTPYACPVCARIADFDPRHYLPENKSERLMNRDALLAVAAARLALRDAQVKPDRDYPAREIALFGSTGLAGVPLAEVARLVRGAAAEDGSLDLERFGAVALRQVRPVLSFKILSNMPICFVSMFENIQGPNGVYNPWEGQGAQAIAAGVRAIERGDVPCALVGGCDVKTHELGFIALQQAGVFRSWQDRGDGCAPGEGAAFLVLEDEARARQRGARCYARLAAHGACTVDSDAQRLGAYRRLLTELVAPAGQPGAVVPSGDGDGYLRSAEDEALGATVPNAQRLPSPRAALGNLFAAAAAVQVALAATAPIEGDGRLPRRILATCFGYGSEQAAFILERP